MSAPMSQIWSGSQDSLHKTDVRTQFATLCYRHKGKRVQVLLVTSRGSGRWIIPKGWPIPGEEPTDAAATEAWEEAGVKGKMHARPVGIFSYIKGVDALDDLPCVAITYAMKVTEVADMYPEAHERERKWMSLKKAAKRASDPELGALILGFDPATLID